jgi:hypothetical protein
MTIQQPTRTQHYYFSETDARMRLFKEVYLFDPDIAVEDVARSGCYLGAIRLGMPTYHAELAVEMLGQRQSKKLVSSFVSGFLPAPDKTRYFKLMEALGLYKLKRDKTLANTKNYGVLKAGRSRVAGEHTAGEFSKIRA